MNPNPNVTVETLVRKTQVMTLWDRQRRMMDFYNLGVNSGTHTYVALARTTPWTDPDDPEVSDTYPPMPSEEMTQVDDLIGMQRIQWMKFAKPYINPTSEQKDDPNSVYYKGLYYQTTDDVDYALSHKFTSLMLLMTADRDQYFPVGVSYRQVGLYVEVNKSDVYLSPEEYAQLSTANKGHLVAVENFMPLTRQLDQLEKHWICLDF